ncbi:MAG: hypothetical protein P8L68_14300 [Paracoccaceae bacterium]|nr:hypothetical protein [Paracoccaceae bacterium]MDG2259654.1 hypothetical protein [Paracoccaceae bacterium]
MKKPGRPSHEEQDRKRLIDMSERWCAGNCNLSISMISRIVVGLEAASSTGKPKYSLADDAEMKPKPSSMAKRLERRFLELRNEKMATNLSVYRVREQERKLAMKARGAITYSAFYTYHQTDPIFASAEEVAVKQTAERCGIEKHDVQRLASVGLDLLRKWFPQEYPEDRI